MPITYTKPDIAGADEYAPGSPGTANKLPKNSATGFVDSLVTDNATDITVSPPAGGSLVVQQALSPSTNLVEFTSTSIAATGSVEITAGTSSPGVNKVSGITVNGVQIMSAAVNWVTSHPATATAVASNINAHTSSPDYTAAAVGAVITITAVTAGAGSNGYVVATTVGGDVTTTDVNMSGGVTSVAGDRGKVGSTGNWTANNFLPGFATTATAAGTTTLTVNSTHVQEFTGTTTQTVVLPVTSTLALGQSWHIINNSTGLVTVNSSGGNLVCHVGGGGSALATCVSLAGTGAASWDVADFLTADVLCSQLAADETFNNDVTLGNTALSVTVATGGFYRIRMVLHITSVHRDVQVDFGGTATADNVAGVYRQQELTGAWAISARVSALNTAFPGAVAEADSTIFFDGSVEIGTGGTLILRGAQAAAAESDTKILRGSTLELLKMN